MEINLTLCVAAGCSPAIDPAETMRLPSRTLGCLGLLRSRATFCDAFRMAKRSNRFDGSRRVPGRFAVKNIREEHRSRQYGSLAKRESPPWPRAAPAGVGEKDAGEARAKFKGDLTEIHHAPRSGGAFDLEAVSIEMVVAFEGLEE